MELHPFDDFRDVEIGEVVVNFARLIAGLRGYFTHIDICSTSISHMMTKLRA